MRRRIFRSRHGEWNLVGLGRKWLRATRARPCSHCPYPHKSSDFRPREFFCSRPGVYAHLYQRWKYLWQGISCQGQLGITDNIPQLYLNPQLVPRFMEEGDTLIKIVCGNNHSMALTAKGALYVWGYSNQGSIGIPGKNGLCAPTCLQQGVRDIACGFEFSLALLQDGSVQSWGSNIVGQLGNGVTL
jgi:alpha-tubulin suppressor-like RCC1 family protein